MELRRVKRLSRLGEALQTRNPRYPVADRLALINFGSAIFSLIIFLSLVSCSLNIYAVVRQTWQTSDSVQSFLEAQSILHGNFLLSGWRLSSDNYIFTDTLFFVVYEWLFGARPEALIVVPSAIYFLITLTCLAASLRSLKPSRHNIAALAAIILLVGLPSLRPPSIHLFSPAAPILLADHHAASILFSLVALMLLAVLARAGRIRDHWGVASMLVLVWVATLASDPFTLVFAFGPAILVLLGDLAPQGNKTKQICLIAIVVTASILGIIIPALLYRLGGPMVEDTIGVSRFIGADDFVTNNQALLFGFLYSSDAYIFGRDLLNTETIAHIVRLCGWILGGMFVIWNLPRLKRHWDGSLLDRILIASIVILTLACIFSEEFTFALGGDVFNGGRCKIYISPLIILSAVLVARAIPTAEAWLPMKTLRSMARNGLVVLAASLLMLRSPDILTPKSSPAWVRTNPYVEVSQWLEARHLNHGIGDYWVSSIIRALTDGRVNVDAAVAWTDGRLEPYVFDADADFHSGAEAPMFVMWREGDDPFDWYHVNAKAVEATYGRPARTEYLPGGFVVEILREPPN